jgi:phage terminase large subunit-like protein
MALLALPPIETAAERWPTLGPGICDWIEDHLVYGPGPLKGEPYVVEPEFRAQLCRLYEVYPQGHRREGRRRFKRGVLSMRKGTAKSEKAAILCIAEAHPNCPVRFLHWAPDGTPVGCGVADPYIPMMAYTEGQAEDTAYGVLRQIIEHSPIASDFDVSLERVLVLDDHGREAGKIQPLAQSPNARDGARTTFQHFDETHRLNSPRHLAARTTMQENLFKRRDADAWQLGTTTAGDSNERSFARDDHEEADLIARGKSSDPTLCYLHRYCPDDDKVWPLRTREEVRAALVEASGPAVAWSADIDALVDQYFSPKTDREYWRRVWLNQWRKGGGKAFDAAAARSLVVAKRITHHMFVTLGFDGARTRDTTGLVATDIESGHQWVLDCWRRPADWPDDEDADPWEIDPALVDAAVADAFDELDVWRLYGDPPHWGEWLDVWAGRYGGTRVVKWWTTRQRAMGHALRLYKQAMADGTISFADDALFFEHLGNAVKRETNMTVESDSDERLWLIEKDRPDSPRKIDLAMCGALSWQARLDAIAAGAKPTKKTKRKARAHSF